MSLDERENRVLIQIAGVAITRHTHTGALSSAVPLYQSETTPSQIRGTLVATYQVCNYSRKRFKTASLAAI